MNSKLVINFLVIIFFTLNCFCQVKIDSINTNNVATNDSINGIYIPINIEDCFKQIDSFWNDSIKLLVLGWTESEFCSEAHMGFGMWMRNNWGLWGGSRLQKFLSNLGYSHPDDMSWVILSTYHNYLSETRPDLQKRAQPPSNDIIIHFEPPKVFKALTTDNRIFYDIDSALTCSKYITYIKLTGFNLFPKKLKKFKNLSILVFEYCDTIVLSKFCSSISNYSNLETLFFIDNSYYYYSLNFNNLPQLKRLYISNFNQIPNSIRNLKNLNEIILTYSTNLNLDSLFNLLVDLDSLKTINLSNNKLDTLPQTINKLNHLERISLDGNNFKEIPSYIQKISNLKHLEMSSNPLEFINIKQGLLNNLRYINLSNTGIVDFPIELLKLKNLETIILGDNEISNIPEDINKHEKLKYISLRNNNFSDEQKDKIVNQFPKIEFEF